MREGVLEKETLSVSGILLSKRNNKMVTERLYLLTLSPAVSDISTVCSCSRIEGTRGGVSVGTGAV